MKFSVLINNYNYGHYVIDCVESVLRQTYAAHEIIVVDDGSTDRSLELLRKHFGGRPEVRIIAQLNQGQVMAVAAGVEAASGDIICLLDADDIYKDDYLAALRDHYAAHPQVDLTFCAADTTDVEDDHEFRRLRVWLNPTRDYDYGYTALITYFGLHNWIGNVTSTLSLRARLIRTTGLREAAEKYYLWRGVDFVLLLATSLLGARKFYLHRDYVKYRHHGRNHSMQKLNSPSQRFLYDILGSAWVTHYRRRCGIEDHLHVHLEDELALVPDPLPEHVALYRSLIESEKARRTPVATKPPAPKPGTFRRLERGFRNWRKCTFG